MIEGQGGDWGTSQRLRWHSRLTGRIRCFTVMRAWGPGAPALQRTTWSSVYKSGDSLATGCTGHGMRLTCPQRRDGPGSCTLSCSGASPRDTQCLQQSTRLTQSQVRMTASFLQSISKLTGPHFSFTSPFAALQLT